MAQHWDSFLSYYKYRSIKIISFQLFELNYGGSEGNFGNWFVMILAWHDEQSGDGLWVNIYKS